MDVCSLTRRTALVNAERECAVHGSRRLTFAEAWTRACRLANALRSLGLGPGDRVAVLEDNRLEAVDVFVGAALAGCARVPLYTRNSPEAHRWMIEHTGCRAVIVDAPHAGAVADVDVPVRLVRDDGYEDWLATFDPTDPGTVCGEEDLYIIRHTGGTTGRPKGVAYSHRSWLAAGRDWFYLFPPVEPGDRCLHVGPISHGSGYFFLPVHLSGGSNVLLDRFDPAEVLEVMEAERIAYVFMVPTMLAALVRQPGAAERDFSALKCLQVGGAPITDDTALAARRVFGDVLWQGYGQTEVVPVTMMGPREWFASVEGSEPLRSAGRPLPFAGVEIRDPDTGETLPLGAEGEIVARADGQMTGYWDDPEATAERMVDGWVRTGDIGRLDANGYLYVLDRKDDMIISGGFNIWPAELENVLCDHPAVIEAAVFGVPDPTWGETPVAVCVVDPDAGVTPAELTELVVRRLGSYKKPSRVELRTEPLPRSPVGKILRNVLREPHWRGHSRRVHGS